MAPSTADAHQRMKLLHCLVASRQLHENQLARTATLGLAVQLGTPDTVASPVRHVAEKFEQLVSTAIWLASMSTLIEGWTASRLSDPVVTGLLREKGAVERLRRLRNAVYHFDESTPFDDARLVGYLVEDPDLEWAAELLREMDRAIAAAP